jgi:hypothetical protein
VIRRVILLAAGCFASWVLLAYPAYRLGTVRALTDSAIAAGICLLPGALTLVVGYFTFSGKPKDRLWIVLGGTGVRMGMVLGVGLILSWLNPHFQQINFWAWVLVFYLFTLTLEMVLLLSAKPKVTAR